MTKPGSERSIEANTNLFAAGEASDTVYFVESGQLEVVHATSDGELVVGTLSEGDVVGEITAVIGGRRTATVRTGDSPAVVRELSADEYGEWLGSRPEEAQRIADQARDRIDHTRVARVLTELIGPGHPEVVNDVNNMLEWARLDAGQTLFEQGDLADAAYIVVTGRLQLTAVANGETVLDVSVGRGDIVGELGIIEQAPRSAGAVATRDTTLARLSESAFEELTGKHPKLMLQVFRKVLSRVMRPNHRPPHAGMIAVAPLSPHIPGDIVRAIAAEIERHGPTLYLDRHQVSRFFNRRGVVDADAGSAEHARLDEFLNEADVAHRWVVLETDRELTTWTSRALRSADRVLFITSPFPDQRELDLVAQFTEAIDATVVDRELWVAQTNQRSIRRPVMSDAIVDRARPDRIVQHHRDTPTSTARLGRLLSGTSTGIALSGGGGRAFAQIGALQALTESGEEFDVLTGTSMGSVVASCFAFLDGPDELLNFLEVGFAGANIMDYTVPIVSFASGRGLTETIERTCGPIRIEELARQFSCLSTNLTKAEVVLHDRGVLADALRATVSLPGVFPPVVRDGDLLVDGGVMENLPVGPLVRDPAVKRIVAIDVAPPDGPSSKVQYGNGVSARQVVRSQVSPNRASYPGLANTVMASMLLSSARARNDALARHQIDQYLSLNLKGVRLMDFDDLATVARRGYEATVDHLASE